MSLPSTNHMVRPGPGDELMQALTRPEGGENGAMLDAKTTNRLTKALKNIATASDISGTFTEHVIALFQNSRLRFVIASTLDDTYKEPRKPSSAPLPMPSSDKDEQQDVGVKREHEAPLHLVGECVCLAIFNLMLYGALETDDSKLANGCIHIIMDAFHTHDDEDAMKDGLKSIVAVWTQTFYIARGCAMRANRVGVAQLLFDFALTQFNTPPTAIFDCSLLNYPSSIADLVHSRYGLTNLPPNCVLYRMPPSMTAPLVSLQRSSGGSLPLEPIVTLYTSGDGAFLQGQYRVVVVKPDRTVWLLELVRVQAASEAHAQANWRAS